MGRRCCVCLGSQVVQNLVVRCARSPSAEEPKRRRPSFTCPRDSKCTISTAFSPQYSNQLCFPPAAPPSPTNSGALLDINAALAPPLLIMYLAGGCSKSSPPPRFHSSTREMADMRFDPRFAPAEVGAGREGGCLTGVGGVKMTLGVEVFFLSSEGAGGRRPQLRKART